MTIEKYDNKKHTAECWDTISHLPIADIQVLHNPVERYLIAGLKNKWEI